MLKKFYEFPTSGGDKLKTEIGFLIQDLKSYIRYDLNLGKII